MLMYQTFLLSFLLGICRRVFHSVMETRALARGTRLARVAQNHSPPMAAAAVPQSHKRNASPPREALRAQPPAPAHQPPRRSPEAEPYRPDFHRDPNVARLMQAMQGYKPENYRPLPKRAPTAPAATSRYDADADSDTDSA